MQSIPWRKFTEGKPKTAEIITFSELFQLGENIITIGSLIYKMRGNPPTLEFTELEEVGAWATPDNRIIVSAGLIAFLEDSPYVDEVLEEYEVPAAAYLFLFVVAHEFVHCTRGHFEVLKEFPEMMPVLEYDADCLAIAILFRYRQALRRSDSLLELKAYLLKSLHWGIRRFIGSSFAYTTFDVDDVSHPCWHIRLAYISKKLSFLDNINQELNQPNERSTREFDELLLMLIQLEFSYLKHSGGEFEQSKFLTFLRRPDLNTRFMHPLSHRYIEIRDKIIRHSKFGIFS